MYSTYLLKGAKHCNVLEVDIADRYEFYACKLTMFLERLRSKGEILEHLDNSNWS